MVEVLNRLLNPASVELISLEVRFLGRISETVAWRVLTAAERVYRSDSVAFNFTKVWLRKGRKETFRNEGNAKACCVEARRVRAIKAGLKMFRIA